MAPLMIISTGGGEPSEPCPTKATITLISNQKEIICTGPVYYARTASDSQSKFGASCIVAQPPSDISFGNICYVQLAAGRKPVVVAAQKDGRIRVGGAYVDSIARELKMIPNEYAGAPSA